MTTIGRRLRKVSEEWRRAEKDGTLTLRRQVSLALEVKSILHSEDGAKSFLESALGVDPYYAEAFFAPRPAVPPTPEPPPASDASLEENPFIDRLCEQLKETQQTVPETWPGGRCLTDGSVEQEARRIKTGMAFMESSSAFDKVCGLILLKGDSVNLSSEDHRIIKQVSGNHSTEEYFRRARQTLTEDNWISDWCTGRRFMWKAATSDSDR